MEDILVTTWGQVEYEHTNGKISHVRISAAGLGIWRVRIANLPPEVPNEVIEASFNSYGLVREV